MPLFRTTTSLDNKKVVAVVLIMGVLMVAALSAMSGYGFNLVAQRPLKFTTSKYFLPFYLATCRQNINLPFPL